MRISIGDKFKAIVRSSEHSKTLGGEEGAGRVMSDLVCTQIGKNDVRTSDFIFSKQLWNLVKI